MNETPGAGAPIRHSNSWRHDRVLIFLMLGAALLGLVYNAVILPAYGPDEGRHMNYVKLLLDESALPYLEPDPKIPGKIREHAGAHSLHPPLYYSVLVPFYALFRGLPGDGVWHVFRFISMLLCVAGLPLWYLVALRAANGEVWIARLATAHLALLPMLGMISGVVNNDSASFLAVALFVWLLSVRFADDISLRAAFIIGLCFGVGGLCKATVLLCNGAALLAFLWLRRDIMPPRSALFWKWIPIIAITLLLVSGPWYARNLAVYDQFAGPIESGYALSDLGYLPRADKLVVMLHENFPFFLRSVNWSVFYSLWSQKDWIPQSIRAGVYAALAVYCLLALVGFIARRRKASASDEVVLFSAQQRAARLAFWCSLAAFGINWLACITIALFKHWGWHEGGRYLLPSLGGLAIALAIGWSGLLGIKNTRLVFGAWCCAMIALNGIAIYWLISHLNPTFGPKA